MAKFIVISGKKQSGKTTAAKYMAGRLPTSKVASFADPIKEFCQVSLGLTEAQIYGSDEDKNSYTDILWQNLPREIQWRYVPTIPACSKCHQVPMFHIGNGVKEGPMTAREVMQIFGTDICRQSFGQDVWVNALFRKYSNTLHKYIVVDDCRFPNELTAARKHKAVTIHLTRDVLGLDQHISEKALDGWITEDRYDHIIDNQDLTIEETKAILKVIVDAPTD